MEEEVVATVKFYKHMDKLKKQREEKLRKTEKLQNVLEKIERYGFTTFNPLPIDLLSKIDANSHGIIKTAFSNKYMTKKQGILRKLMERC